MADEMFRPPINRAMRKLDKSFFQKEVLTSAARVTDVKRMSEVLKLLRKSHDVFGHKEFPQVRDLTDGLQSHTTSTKCVLLDPRIQADGAWYSCRVFRC